jgi:hypothetical protein
MTSSGGSRLLELADRAWGELTDYEGEEFSRWLQTASGLDLYLLLRHARRHRRQSSSETLRAVRGSDPDDDGA